MKDRRPRLRLADCGDWLTAQEYSDWVIQSVNTTYKQLHDGTTLVPVATIKPSPRWRRADCEAKLHDRNLVIEQRKKRAQRKFGKGLAKAS